MPGERVILTLFAQVALILAFTRLMGWILSRFHQPQMLGAMIAGIILGPSLLGWAAPQAYQHLFPQESLQLLAILSQIGLIFFVFLIGLELESTLLRGRDKSTLTISLSSIAFPFALGLLIALPFFKWTTALLVATAMSVSAFPVLARIVTERNLHRSQLGILSIASSAVTNLATWCILTAVILIAHHSFKIALATAIYLAAMVVLIRPLLSRLQLLYQQQA